MKRSLIIFLPFVFFYACGNTNAENTSIGVAKLDSAKPANGNVDSLTSKYIRKFEIGDPAKAQKVFDFYKNYDANTLDSAREDFADSVGLDLADGKLYNLSKDSLISFFKKERAPLQSSLHVPDAFVALKNTSDSAVWVSVWERKIDVIRSKKDITLLNENWKFNEAGKMVFLRQYNRKFVERN